MWEKISQPGSARQWHGDIPIHHRYTLGVAGERFFKALRDDRTVLASKCSACGQAFLPPKIYCERCFVDAEDWVPVAGPGYVKNFTVMHQSLDDEPLEPPSVAILVGWKGIRGGILHELEGIQPEDVRNGMSVEPVWAEQRTGSIRDILHFRPADEDQQ